MTHKEANFAGCPACGELFHLDHLEWVKAKDARLLSLETDLRAARAALGDIGGLASGAVDADPMNTLDRIHAICFDALKAAAAVKEGT